MALLQRCVLILVSLLFTFQVTMAQQQEPTLITFGGGARKGGPTRVTVTDKYGRYVSGLSKDRFAILDEKIPQEIVGFEQQDEPFSLVVLFDLSKSIPANGHSTAREEFWRLCRNGK